MKIWIGKVGETKEVHLAMPGDSCSLCLLEPFEAIMTLTERDREFLRSLEDRDMMCEKCMDEFRKTEEISP